MIYYAESESYDVYENLAMEEYLFRILPKGCRCLMLWQNRDTVVIGKYQNAAEEIDYAYVQEQGIRVARRLSGGGAVFHDLGNLNYTIIEDDILDKGMDFSWYLVPVLTVLHDFGLEAEFSGRNDILVQGRKVSGCAQYESGGRILHHGCILVETDLDRLERALQPPAAKFQSKSTKSVRSRIATVNSFLNESIQVSDLKEKLKETITGEQENICHLSFSEVEKKEIRRLRDEKYASWEWIYGYEADYQVHKQRKYPVCLLSASMNIREGRIESIRFSGDFFGSGEIRELEKKICGLRMDENLLDLLEKMDIGHYIQGIGAEELYQLLLE